MTSNPAVNRQPRTAAETLLLVYMHGLANSPSDSPQSPEDIAARCDNCLRQAFLLWREIIGKSLSATDFILAYHFLLLLRIPPQSENLQRILACQGPAATDAEDLKTP